MSKHHAGPPVVPLMTVTPKRTMWTYMISITQCQSRRINEVNHASLLCIMLKNLLDEDICKTSPCKYGSLFTYLFLNDVLNVSGNITFEGGRVKNVGKRLSGHHQPIFYLVWQWMTRTKGELLIGHGLFVFCRPFLVLRFLFYLYDHISALFSAFSSSSLHTRIYSPIFT